MFDPATLSASFKDSFPLWTKLIEKCKYKDMIIKNYENTFKIKGHSRHIENDGYKVFYYTIADIEPIYIRDKTESEILNKHKYEDVRDKGNILFDMLCENIHEAFTSEKAKRSFDNSFLELFGEGIISLFLGWNYILMNPTRKTRDIKLLTEVEHYHKKMFEIIASEENNLYKYVVPPVHKTLEFFIPPIMKTSYYLSVKFFDRNQEFFSKFENINGTTIELKYDEDFEEKLGSCDFQQSKKPYQEYLLFISELNKSINNIEQDYKYSYSTSTMKSVSKYFKGAYIDFLNHDDFVSMFKALVGAAYNCCGFEGANRIMKKYTLISDDCIIAYENDTKKKFQAYNVYKRIIDCFWKLYDQDEETLKELIYNLTGYKFENPNILTIALTHKSKSKYKNESIWDDYRTMSLLGKCATRFFNCKRIITKRKELLINKDHNLTKIQRLRSFLATSEKIEFLGLICIKSGIYSHIIHKIKYNHIQKFKDFVESINEVINFDDFYNFQIDVLADVINSIFGAILIDSCKLLFSYNQHSNIYI